MPIRNGKFTKRRIMVAVSSKSIKVIRSYVAITYSEWLSKQLKISKILVRYHNCGLCVLFSNIDLRGSKNLPFLR